mmetsp:Transcript_28687/g.68216  ORF Transcript_28687/g.68216 Transcript_28687/m.68216 type:complete len:216 (+) Transcript_28687:125-772(+)
MSSKVAAALLTLEPAPPGRHTKRRPLKTTFRAGCTATRSAGNFALAGPSAGTTDGSLASGSICAGLVRAGASRSHCSDTTGLSRASAEMSLGVKVTVGMMRCVTSLLHLSAKVAPRAAVERVSSSLSSGLESVDAQKISCLRRTVKCVVPRMTLSPAASAHGSFWASFVPFTCVPNLLPMSMSVRPSGSCVTCAWLREIDLSLLTTMSVSFRPTV